MKIYTVVNLEGCVIENVALNECDADNYLYEKYLDAADYYKLVEAEPLRLKKRKKEDSMEVLIY